MPTLGEDIYQKIIDDYNSGMTQKQVGIENGVGRDAVGNILRRFKIPIREYTGDRQSQRKWFWDFDFFYRDDSTTAYWAGFLMADGSIRDDANRCLLVCYVNSHDAEHIKSFLVDVGLPDDAFYTTREGYVGFQITHPGLVTSLKRWGIVPNKTKKFYVPDFPLSLLPHYLRGWIDGDGSVYRYGRASRIVVASGNKPSLDWFADALRVLGYDGHIGVKQVYNKKYPDNYFLYIGGALQIARVCELLQVDTSFCMKRKWTSRRD